MANENKRITQLPTAPQVEDNDYIALDNTSTPSAENDGGSRKILAKDVMAKNADAVDYDNTSSGLEADNVQDAIDEVLEEGGKVQDVYENGESVVDPTDKIARIHGHKEVTQAQYDALPSSKLTDGIMYCIKDSTFSASDVPYDNSDSGLESEEVQSAIDEVVGEIEDIQTDVDNKADVDGMYEELFAGNLLSDSYTADNTPYLYRQSPSASSVEQNIVGGTVAWNQLVQNVESWANQNTDSRTTFQLYCGGSLVGNISNVGLFQKILHRTSNISSINIKHNGSTLDLNIYNNTSRGLIENHNYLISLYVLGADPTTIGGISLKNLMLIDLTQMFGTTIADYIYTLEQATAGSGIAWLKSYGFLTKDYYAYDSGSLQSVNVSGRKIVGVNQWDEEWEVGAYNTNDGTKANTNTQIRSKNYIKVIPNVSYYWLIPYTSVISGFAVALYYDANKNFIRYQNMVSNGEILTMPSDCEYVTFFLSSLYGTTYNNDISINYPSTDTEYHAYEEHNYPTSPIDLRGLFKLETGNLVADGDVYSADGGVKRKYGVVDLGSFNWVRNEYAQGGYAYFRSGSFSNWKNASYPNFLCTKYISATSRLAMNIDKSIAPYTDSNYGEIFIRDDSYTDETAFKTAMNGVYLIYELATPTSDSADAFTNPQLVGSTEEFIDTRDVPIPVGGERKYHTDLKAKLEELAKIPDVPSANGTYTLKATRSASGVEYSWVNG